MDFCEGTHISRTCYFRSWKYHKSATKIQNVYITFFKKVACVTDGEIQNLINYEFKINFEFHRLWRRLQIGGYIELSLLLCFADSRRVDFIKRNVILKPKDKISGRLPDFQWMLAMVYVNHGAIPWAPNFHSIQQNIAKIYARLNAIKIWQIGNPTNGSLSIEQSPKTAQKIALSKLFRKRSQATPNELRWVDTWPPTLLASKHYHYEKPFLNLMSLILFFINLVLSL